MNLGTRLRGRPRNIWQDEVWDDGKIVGGEGWQEKVHNREERKKLLRKARNHRTVTKVWNNGIKMGDHERTKSQTLGFTYYKTLLNFSPL